MGYLNRGGTGSFGEFDNADDTASGDIELDDGAHKAGTSHHSLSIRTVQAIDDSDNSDKFDNLDRH